MTNLLPPAAKKQVIREYWLRMGSAWVMLWSVSLLVGAVLLWPTYVLLSGNNQAFMQSSVAAADSTVEFEALSRGLNESMRQAEDIMRLSKQQLFSIIADDVWEIVNRTNVTIDRLSLSRADGALQPFSVGGTAADRESLAEFRDQLQALPYVDTVELPIENLAGSEDIDFALEIIVLP